MISAATFAEIIFLAAIWGASFPIIRHIVPEFGALPLTFLRCAIGAAVLMAWLAWRGDRLQWSTHQRWYLNIGLIGNAMPFVLLAFATSVLPASYPSVINATVPLWGALLAAPMLGERLTARRLAGVLVGLAGVVVLVGAGPIALSPPVLVAALAGVTACLCFALSQMITKKHASHIDAVRLTTGMLLVSAVVLIPVLPLQWPARNPSLQAWAWIVVLAIANSAYATTRYMALVVRIGPVRAMTVPLLIPVFGVGWSVLFLGEVLSLLFLAGSLLVLAATWLVAREHR